MLVHVFDWLIAIMLSRREAPSAALALLLRECRSEPVDEGKVPRLEQMPPVAVISQLGARGRLVSTLARRVGECGSKLKVVVPYVVPYSRKKAVVADRRTHRVTNQCGSGEGSVI